MSSRSLHSDASGTTGNMDPEDAKALRKEVEEDVKQTIKDVMESTGFTQHFPHADLSAIPTTNVVYRNTVGHHHHRPIRTGNTYNQFNITGGTIGQAAIGNSGPVTFNRQEKIFKEGSENRDINISGGNFSQANIGGETTFNNKNSTITAGTGADGAGVTIEKLLMYILEKGVTAEELIKLLEARYSLANIAFSMPTDPERKAKMIRALLTE